MFKSATFKLTMWYLAIAMAISILFSFALYNVTTAELSRGLNSESRVLINRYPVFDNDPNFSFRADPYIDTSSHRILLRLIFFNILVLIGAGVSSYFLAKRTLEPIEAALEQQKRFTADVSHELRTPLTAIKMESEVALLNAKPSANELKKTLTSNLEEVTKLENLINNLLKLTKLEAVELIENFTKANANKLASGAIDMVEKSAKARSVKIEAELKTNFAISVDQESWTQLLIILLENAIKYSPKKSTVQISTVKKDANIIYQIKDHGVGIEPSALAHVFDRFYQAKSSRHKVNNEGYGLGLSIAKMIADIHSANITISSRVNHGTTVKVILPIKAAT